MTYPKSRRSLSPCSNAFSPLFALVSLLVVVMLCGGMGRGEIHRSITEFFQVLLFQQCPCKESSSNASFHTTWLWEARDCTSRMSKTIHMPDT